VLSESGFAVVELESLFSCFSVGSGVLGLVVLSWTCSPLEGSLDLVVDGTSSKR